MHCIFLTGAMKGRAALNTFKHQVLSVDHAEHGRLCSDPLRIKPVTIHVSDCIVYTLPLACVNIFYIVSPQGNTPGGTATTKRKHNGTHVTTSFCVLRRRGLRRPWSTGEPSVRALGGPLAGSTPRTCSLFAHTCAHVADGAEIHPRAPSLQVAWGTHGFLGLLSACVSLSRVARITSAVCEKIRQVGGVGQMDRWGQRVFRAREIPRVHRNDGRVSLHMERGHHIDSEPSGGPRTWGHYAVQVQVEPWEQTVKLRTWD